MGFSFYSGIAPISALYGDETYGSSIVGLAALARQQDRASFFPEEYNRRLTYYQTMESWYTGQALEATTIDIETGREIELYPLRINPIKSIVSKHVHALLGIGSNGVLPIVHKAPAREDFSTESRAALNNIVNRLLIEAGAPSVLNEAARMAQVYGGFFIRAGIDMTRRAPYWQFLNPKHVFVVPYANYIDIAEAWVFFFISANEAAQRYKYPVSENEEDVLLYREHWTAERLEIYIEDSVVRSERNPYGFVPFVYIPHTRSGGFWGESLVEDLIGLVRELNLRFTDFGDAVHRDSEELLAIRNVTTPRIQQITPKRQVINLGSNMGVNANSQPDMWDVRSTTSKASQAMSELVDDLWRYIMRVSYTPAVAFGEDEGSQRSALTLETRFWPLTAHTEEERRNWDTMLRRLTVMTLRMIENKRRYLDPSWLPPDGWLEQDIAFHWAEQLPRDIETTVKNLVQRAQNNLGSMETLLAQLPDVDNPEEEIKAIKDWLEFLAELKAKSKAGGNAAEQARSERKGATSAAATVTAPKPNADM